MKATTSSRGLLEVKTPKPADCIKVDVDLLREPTGLLIAINALLTYKLGGRVQYSTEELLAFLREGRTLVQESVYLRATGRTVVEMSVPTLAPPPHRDQYL